MNNNFHFRLSMLLIMLIFSSSCSFNKVEVKEAIACSDGYLNAIKEGKKEKALEFYSDAYDEDGNTEKRMEKINKLDEFMGPVISYTLTDSVKTTSGDLEAVILTYLVNNSKVNSIQKFTIMKDEGTYKIHAHDIQTKN